MSSRQEQKRRLREAREASERDAARRSTLRARLGLVGGVAVLLSTMALAIVVFPGSSGPRPGASIVKAGSIPAQRTSDLGEAVRLAGARRISDDYEFGIGEHSDDPVAYPTNPPTNGPHANTWTPDGSYAGLPAPVAGRVVHAQEHGRIVIQYRPGLPRTTLQQLQALYEESPQHVLLVENATDMPCDVAVTAWSQGLLCPEVTPRTFDALRAFRDTYRDRGPEVVA